MVAPLKRIWNASGTWTTPALASVLEKFDSAEASWKPGADRWSLVEIANHLADEELEDFRLRLQSIQEDPSRDWPSIDQAGSPYSLKYAGPRE